MSRPLRVAVVWKSFFATDLRGLRGFVRGKAVAEAHLEKNHLAQSVVVALVTARSA